MLRARGAGMPVPWLSRPPSREAGRRRFPRETEKTSVSSRGAGSMERSFQLTHACITNVGFLVREAFLRGKRRVLWGRKLR